MTTKQPVPPPKFNIRDQVMYNGRRWKITNRKYKSCNWFYDLEVIEIVDGFITEINTKEGNLTLAPPSKLDPMQFPVPDKTPTPYYPNDSDVLYDGRIWKVVKSALDKARGWYYEIESTQENGSKVCIHAIHELGLRPAPTPKVSPQETTTVVNEQGGKQSHLDARFDCIPPVVLRLLAQCLGFGARKYGKDNWKNIPQWDHLNHAMNHINEWNRGNRDEPHLVNAMARLTFALWQAVDSNDQSDTYLHPDDTK